MTHICSRKIGFVCVRNYFYSTSRNKDTFVLILGTVDKIIELDGQGLGDNLDSLVPSWDTKNGDGGMMGWSKSNE